MRRNSKPQETFVCSRFRCYIACCAHNTFVYSRSESCTKTRRVMSPPRTTPVFGAPSGLAMEERRRQIRLLIEENAQGTVNDLVQHFGVSAVTIRADLAALE